MVVRSFSPGNVSAIFRVIADEDPSKMHSLGFSFTLSQGVYLKLKENPSTRVTFNGLEFNCSPLNQLLKSLLPTNRSVSIAVESELPLGSGYGLSGAICLSAALGINQLFELGLSRLALGKAAHLAEVTQLTGLSDVCGQFYGGMVVRLVPKEPFTVKTWPLDDQEIYVKNFAPLSTASVLGSEDATKRINHSADKVLEQIKSYSFSTPSFKILTDLAYSFAHNSGLLSNKDVVTTINNIRSSGGSASMIMLGHSVYSLNPFEGSKLLKCSSEPAKLV